MQELADAIRTVPDFPKKGIQFKDISTLLKNGEVFKKSVDLLAERYREVDLDAIVGIEARGFIFGAALAYALGKGFVIVRKPGKLPAKTRQIRYELEYGADTLEVHEDAIGKGQKILIVDDLLATGGTVSAVTSLLRQMGADVIGCAFLVELDFLKGREKLPDLDIFTLVHF